MSSGKSAPGSGKREQKRERSGFGPSLSHANAARDVDAEYDSPPSHRGGGTDDEPPQNRHALQNHVFVLTRVAAVDVWWTFCARVARGVCAE